jgi:hypothetical protein
MLTVGQENRRFQRFEGTLTVHVSGDGIQRFGTICEVSQGGAFLAVSPVPAVGSTVLLTVKCRERQVSLAAEVRYYSSGLRTARGLEGVGIAWAHLGADEQAFVAEIISRAAAGRPLRDEDR